MIHRNKFQIVLYDMVFVLFVIYLVIIDTKTCSSAPEDPDITVWIMARESFYEIDGVPSVDIKAYEKYLNDFKWLKIDTQQIKGETEKRTVLHGHVLWLNKGIIDPLIQFKKNETFDKLIINLKLLSWRKNLYKHIIDQAKNAGVDVLQVPSTWMADLVEKKLLKDITDCLKPFIEQGEYLPPVVASCNVAEQYYAFPWSLDVRSFYYNQEIFDKMGVEPETLKNLNQLSDLCSSFNMKKNEFVIGLPTLGPECFQQALCWIWGYGGDLLDSHGSIKLMDKKTIDGMTNYVKLAMNGCAKFDQGTTLKSIEEGFLKGQYSLVYQGPWLISKFDNDYKFGAIGALPGPDAKSANTFIGGCHLGLVNSKRTEFEFKISKALVVHLATNSNNFIFLSASKSLRKENKHTLLQPIIDSLTDQYARALPIIPNMRKIESIMSTHISMIFKKLEKAHDRRESHIRHIIKSEFQKAQKALKKLVEPVDSKARRIHLLFITIFVAGCVFVIIIYIVKKFSKEINMPQIDYTTVEKTIKIKADLHNSKPDMNTIENLVGNIENIMKDVKQFSLNKLLNKNERNKNTILADLQQYINLIKQNNTKVAVDFFNNEIRDIISKMEKLLIDNCIDQEKMNNIRGEYNERFKNIKIILTENYDDYSPLINNEDLKVCLDNIISNSINSIQKAEEEKCQNISNKIELIIQNDIEDQDNQVLIVIKDFGIGITEQDINDVNNGKKVNTVDRKRGSGINDVKYIIEKKWGGKFEITSEGICQGAETKLTLKQSSIKYNNEE